MISSSAYLARKPEAMHTISVAGEIVFALNCIVAIRHRHVLTVRSTRHIDA